MGGLRALHGGILNAAGLQARANDKKAALSAAFSLA
jgi:hypothetical protein